jgi:amidase
MARKPWQEVAAPAQEARDKSIALVQPPVPKVPVDLPLNVTRIPGQLLTPSEVEITETAPEILVQKLASGELTSVEVITAFLRRAGLAQKLVETFYPYELSAKNQTNIILRQTV